MQTPIEIRFPGGLAVDAEIAGFTVHTDQLLESGGRGAAPTPFDLFLASIGTCAGYYALRFCREREIATDGMALRLTTEKDPAHGRLARVRLELELPADFPAKYTAAVTRAMDQCAVKRSLSDPPVFEIAAQRFSKVIAAEFMQ